MIVALQLAQATRQVVHFRFAEGQRFFQLIAARAVVAELAVQFIATNARAFFRAAVGTYANILQLFVQIVQQLFLGIEGAFQRGHDLTVLAQLCGMRTHGFTSAGTLGFSLLQALTQLFIQIAVSAEHFCGIGVAEVGATLYDFRQGKRLLTRFALHLL